MGLTPTTIVKNVPEETHPRLQALLITSEWETAAIKLTPQTEQLEGIVEQHNTHLYRPLTLIQAAHELEIGPEMKGPVKAETDTGGILIQDEKIFYSGYTPDEAALEAKERLGYPLLPAPLEYLLIEERDKVLIYGNETAHTGIEAVYFLDVAKHQGPREEEHYERVDVTGKNFQQAQAYVEEQKRKKGTLALPAVSYNNIHFYASPGELPSNFYHGILSMEFLEDMDKRTIQQLRSLLGTHGLLFIPRREPDQETMNTYELLTK